MVVVSFVLAFLALLFAIAGAIFAIVPYVGIACSVLAVLSALGGIVTGAKAHAEGKARGDGGSAPGIAIGLNVAVFLLSLCVVSTCGACNALLSTSERSGHFYVSGPDGSIRSYEFGNEDGGVRVLPTPFDPAHATPPPVQAVPDAPSAPDAPAPPGSAPPPAMPPPPMPAP